jgi:hypothetical protein
MFTKEAQAARHKEFQHSVFCLFLLHKDTKKCAKAKENRIFFAKNLVVMLKILTFAGEIVNKS